MLMYAIALALARALALALALAMPLLLSKFKIITMIINLHELQMELLMISKMNNS